MIMNVCYDDAIRKSSPEKNGKEIIMMSRKKRIIGLLAAGALAVTACGMSGIMAAANETGREETMRAEDTYTFELSSQVERRPVRYKNRYGIELSADMYLPKDWRKAENIRQW